MRAQSGHVGRASDGGLDELKPDDLAIDLILGPNDARAAGRLSAWLDVQLGTNLHHVFNDEAHATITHIERPRRSLIPGAAQSDAV